MVATWSFPFWILLWRILIVPFVPETGAEPEFLINRSKFEFLNLNYRYFNLIRYHTSFLIIDRYLNLIRYHTSFLKNLVSFLITGGARILD